MSNTLIETLNQLRQQYESPVSTMAALRDALQHRASAGAIPMPPILNETQRKQFVDRIDLLREFLEHSDGKDAVELFLATWSEFIAQRDLLAL